MLTHFAIAVVGLLLCAAVTDLLSRRIPNVIPAAVTALFVAAAVIFPHEISWLSAAGVAVVVLAAGTVLFAMGKVGGGDVKLLTACALWAGVQGLAPLLVVTALCGGFLALAQLAPQGIWYVTSAFSRKQTVTEMPTVQSLPYGVAIAVGGSFAVFTQLILT